MSGAPAGTVQGQMASLDQRLQIALIVLRLAPLTRTASATVIRQYPPNWSEVRQSQ